jgi:hypothetical protein
MVRVPVQLLPPLRRVRVAWAACVGWEMAWCDGWSRDGVLFIVDPRVHFPTNSGSTISLVTTVVHPSSARPVVTELTVHNERIFFTSLDAPDVGGMRFQPPGLWSDEGSSG